MLEGDKGLAGGRNSVSKAWYGDMHEESMVNLIWLGCGENRGRRGDLKHPRFPKTKELILGYF